MNILDTLQEVWTTLSAHPLRTMLTALSVAWGIFMLVILLAAGDGLSKGATHQFRDDAVNSLWIYGGTTQKPFDGHPVNRKIVLNNDDYDLLSREIEGIEHITSRFYFNYRSMQISHGDRRGAFDIRASHPDHQFIEMSNITEGRFLNDLDIRDARKVAVIGVDVVKPLFGDEDPMGKTIVLAGTHYTVVGIFSDDGGAREQRKIYVPISTAQLLSGGTSDVRQIMFTLMKNVSLKAIWSTLPCVKAWQQTTASRPMTAPHFASETIWKNTSASRASSPGSASLFGWLASAPLQPVSWASVISC